MLYPSGQVAGNTPWHVYRYPQKPGTLMRLGSILTEPDNIGSSINFRDGIEPFPEDEIHDETLALQRAMKAALNRGGGGSISTNLPAFLAPMVSVGGAIGATVSRDVDTVAEALGIRAETVFPDSAADYMNRALALPNVEAHLRKTFFRKALYMIVGVATCRKLVMREAVSRQTGANIEVGASLVAQTVEASVGAEFNISGRSETALTIDEECAFAYRVRKFHYYRIVKKARLKKDWIKGAMFGIDDGHVVESDIEDPMLNAGAEFEYFEEDDEDLCAEKVGSESMITVQIVV